MGVNRVRFAPDRLPTTPQPHGASEELYFVLAGSGLAWQDGEVWRGVGVMGRMEQLDYVDGEPVEED